MTINGNSYNSTMVDMTGKAAVSKLDVSSLFSTKNRLSCHPANDVMRNLSADLSESLLIAAFLFSPPW